MHHKRQGPKSTRAGCLFCKPYKRQGAKRFDRMKFGGLRRRLAQRHDLNEHGLVAFDRSTR